MRDRHGIEVAWANEALEDPEALRIVPDPASSSGRSIGTIGCSLSAGRLLTVITVTEGDVVYGSAGGPTTSTSGDTERTVIAALKAAGLSGKVKVVGNDGIADAVKVIKDGTLYATNAESPFSLGSEVMALAGKVANGEKVEKNKVLEGFLVKSAGVASYCKKLADLGDTATCK